MKLISLSFNVHDSSLTFLQDGKIVCHLLSERLSKIKNDYEITKKFQFFVEILKDRYDYLSAIILHKPNKDLDDCTNLLETQSIFQPKSGFFTTNFLDHHLSHAYSGFYSSKFNDALCFVFDGDGSEVSNLFPNKILRETETIFVFKNKRCNNVPVYQKYRIHDGNNVYENYTKDDSHNDFYIKDNVLCTKNYSIGNKFELLSESMGFGWNGAGKVMGLAQYKFNKDKLPGEYNTDFWKDKVDEAYNLQMFSKNHISNLIKKYYKQTGIKNIIISGGVGLNCVINYHLVKEFPELNFHIDPICSDSGISLGNCFNEYIKITNKLPKRITNVYLGYKKHDFDMVYIKNFLNHSKVEYGDIVNLLIQGNIVALFQGKSEIGQRSLGNRSLLFDPRIKNGKDIVNKIKNRENFRPFAASILLEKAHEWFDLKNLKESQYMSFAIDAYEKTVEKVPAVIHVDNTSRIQTITKKQNYHFYNLIKEFYKRTSIPMLLNTSFNLAGYPVVETFEDAIDTLRKSEIEYLYLPEIKILIKISNI